MNPIGALLAAIVSLLIGAAITALTSRYRRLCGYIAFAFTAGACVGIFWLASYVFSKGTVSTSSPLLDVWGLGAVLTFKVDPLSALFLMITSLIAFSATLYSIRYILLYERESLLRYYPLLLLFFASVICVVTTWNMFFFIIFWEFMTLTSYALVVFERENHVNLTAGFKYFVVTHIATFCILVATIVLYLQTEPKSFDWQALRVVMETLLLTKPWLVHLILGLFFIGFVTKAGILPFGFWLPDAYPAAPSAASAAFAGTMTKLGVYGIVRIFVGMLPISHFSFIWGQIIAIFGTISIFIGTCTALVQKDSKRLLSFHIIGQVGYMLLGVGLGVCFLRINPTLATAGLMAGLFHVVNHACYKSCLFLNAGAALYRTGTRNLAKIGGLAKTMPVTAGAAVIASLSIAGIPPFSGFSSKWLIFQSSIIGGIELPLFVFLGIIAIFISAVTLASFLKFIGTAFLGKLYVEGKEIEKTDVPISMKIPQILLAVFCVLFGILPMLPIFLLHKAVSAILPLGYAPQMTWLFGNSPAGVNLNLGEGIIGIWNPLFVVGGLLICLLIAYGIYKAAKAPVRSVSTWFCGEEHTVDEARYKAPSFYTPFQDFLAFRVGKYRITTYFPSLPRPRVGSLKKLRKIVNIDEWFYYPVVRLGKVIASRFSETHVGIPQVYVLWIAVGWVLAIIILFALS